MSKYPIKRVSQAELRELFNTGNFAQRREAGEFTILRHAGKPSSGAPGDCVASVEERWIETATGEEVIRTHHYERVDGSIGASGMRDPKRLLYEGAIHRMHKQSLGGTEDAP